MQEYIDQRVEEMFLLSNLEPDGEKIFSHMSTYEFYFYLSVKMKHKPSE